MTTLPLSTFWDTSKTEGEANSGWFQKILSVMKELPGGAESITELTISSGSITPTTAAHIVDTEADASTDDLSVKGTPLSSVTSLIARSGSFVRKTTPWPP